MIERTIFREEHEIFRQTVRRFVDREIVPFHAKWEADGIVPRELWLKAGAAGLLCCTVPEQYGGMGLDYLFDVVVFEELWRAGASGPGFLIHTDLVATYLLSFGTEAQKRRWLPKMVSGEAIGSLGMTEPHAGSDLKAIRTPSRPVEIFMIVLGHPGTYPQLQQIVKITNGKVWPITSAAEVPQIFYRAFGRRICQPHCPR